MRRCGLQRVTKNFTVTKHEQMEEILTHPFKKKKSRATDWCIEEAVDAYHVRMVTATGDSVFMPRWSAVEMLGPGDGAPKILSRAEELGKRKTSRSTPACVHGLRIASPAITQDGGIARVLPCV
jgi:hypothetical protein